MNNSFMFTIFPLTDYWQIMFNNHSYRCGTQVVKGAVCKTAIRRFKSDPHLLFANIFVL